MSLGYAWNRWTNNFEIGRGRRSQGRPKELFFSTLVVLKNIEIGFSSALIFNPCHLFEMFIDNLIENSSEFSNEGMVVFMADK